jgi:hypothetical protein
VLRPGQFSLHDVGMLHGSHANRSDRPRVGLAIRFVTPSTHNTGSRDYATLVRGEDRFRHFRAAPLARYDGDPVARRAHKSSMRGYLGDVLRELLRRPDRAIGLGLRFVTRPGALGTVRRLLMPSRKVG